MADQGFCKIEFTAADAEKVGSTFLRVVEQRNECQQKINEGCFQVPVERRFLFFTVKTTRFDYDMCDQAYPELFNYAYVMPAYNDGPVAVHTSRSFNLLRDVARILKTKGDAYLTPDQCFIFRSITGVEREDRAAPASPGGKQ